MTIHDQKQLIRQASPGPALYSYSALPDSGGQRPKAVVGLLHGYGEYAARYERVMDVWAERGIASVAIDLRGHGRAQGKRGFCERFEEFLDDTLELERLTAERSAPAFLFGHSFGGLVAASAALERPAPWKALIMSAPLFGIAMDVPPIKRLAGRVASRLLPGLSMPNGIRSTDVTHDTALAAVYDKDPLVFHIATARWFTEVQAAQRRASAKAASLTMPLYVVMGTEDKISSYTKARAFFDAAGATDKTWDKRDGLFHEVLNEFEWRTIADKIADFVLARV
jgi:alpha-beta hydrolase superfamily lysophospholipase